jgi:hypothetical protein
VLKDLQPGLSDAWSLRLTRDGQVSRNLKDAFRTGKSLGTVWANSLKSRDFR